MNLILIGIQGSGKGTQAQLLAKNYKLAHISIGELLREEEEKKTWLGKKIAILINKGSLVPDRISVAMAKKKIEEIEKSKKYNGYILDGFPRNLNQAKKLSKFAKIDHVINFTLTDKESMNRIVSRVECAKCGSIYSTLKYKKKTCQKCGGILKRRADDNDAAVMKRIKTFHALTEPVVEFYKKNGLLKVVDGKNSISKVYSDTKKVLK